MHPAQRFEILTSRQHGLMDRRIRGFPRNWMRWWNIWFQAIKLEWRWRMMTWCWFNPKSWIRTFVLDGLPIPLSGVLCELIHSALIFNMTMVAWCGDGMTIIWQWSDEYDGLFPGGEAAPLFWNEDGGQILIPLPHLLGELISPVLNFVSYFIGFSLTATTAMPANT